MVPPWVPAKPDLAVAGAALVLVLAGTAATALREGLLRPLDAGAFVLVSVAALALAWRRTAPVLTLGIIVVPVAAYLFIGYPYGPAQLCVMFAMFEVGRLRPLRISLPACAVAVAVMVVATLSRVILHAQEPALLLVVFASWLIIPWSIGSLVQVRTTAAQRSRRELAARAALQERMRVAREVHDVAGHGFSAVAMQAGVALLVFDEQPEQAKRSLEAIQSTSTKALADLRAMLDAFGRRAGATAETGEPAIPGLPDLRSLVDSVRAAGLAVRLSLEGGVAVPEPVGHAAYRVVQEALTNVLRHAGPTIAAVDVHLEGGTLVVQVQDAGAGAAGEVKPGRGITGMRNRVRAAGGQLTAEPCADGGFRVVAHLPAVAREHS